MTKKLSIIVPVYKVEKYIRPCIESILNQGLNEDDYELIIVNDDTPDRSMEQISDLLEQHSNVIVINQENQGVSVARNNGLAKATGEYILFFDSDDIVINGSLRTMFDKAMETHADLLIANYLESTDDEMDNVLSTFSQPEIHWTEKTGKQYALYGTCSPSVIVCRCLYRREFLVKNQILFPTHMRFEDNPFSWEVFLRARKCMITNLKFFIYRRRDNSFTTGNVSMGMMEDYATAIAMVWRLKDKLSLTDTERERFGTMFFPVFCDFFLTYVLRHFHKYSDRIKTVDYLHQQAPDIRLGNSLFRQFISYLYRNTPHLFMSLFICTWETVQFLRTIMGKRRR